MPDDADARTLAALRTMLDRAHLATPGQLADVVSSAAGELGWAAEVHLVDHDQEVLVPLVASGRTAAEEHGVDSTLAGRSFRTVEPVRWATDGVSGVWLPLLDGTDRLGVLRVTAEAGTDLDGPVFLERCRLLAHLTGHLLVAKSPYGDALAQVRRRRRRSVASELLWQLLPPLTHVCPGLVVSGLLQPAYDVAADAFDYSVAGELAHLAVLDATGHDLAGTLLAAVALAAYRNGRREGLGLQGTVQQMDRLVAEQGRREKFATGVVSQLDLRTGQLFYVNAGHPAPLLLRRGRVVKQLTGGRRPLLGLDLGRGPVRVGEERLEPGDWVVFYTDGITEARSPDGGFFGLDRFVDQLERSAAADQPAPETVRRVVRDVLVHQDGVLQDDTTLLVAEWATRPERGLVATGSETAGSVRLWPAAAEGRSGSEQPLR